MIEYVRYKAKEKEGNKENVSPRQTFYMRKVKMGDKIQRRVRRKGYMYHRGNITCLDVCYTFFRCNHIWMEAETREKGTTSLCNILCVDLFLNA